MRAARRLKSWEKAGLIRRDAEAIIVTTPVTSTVTDVSPAVTEAVSITLTPETAVARRSMMPVKLAAFIVAPALACVSAAFPIDGLTAIFTGAFWPVITMGAALEAGSSSQRHG
jgi:hypothetical protein